jgi:hypothetical protein
MAVSGSIGPAETSAAGVHAFPGAVSSPNPVDLARWLCWGSFGARPAKIMLPGDVGGRVSRLRRIASAKALIDTSCAASRPNAGVCNAGV